MTVEQPTPNDHPSGEPVVGRNNIANAVEAAAEMEVSCEVDLIAGEPLLSAYLREGVLQIAGKLALAGGGPQVVQNVTEDVLRLLNVAANSPRSAYRAFLDDLLPGRDAGAANEEPGATPPERGTEEHPS